MSDRATLRVLDARPAVSPAARQPATGPDVSNLTPEPEAFLALYERDRRYHKAYRNALDSEDPDSDAFFEANDGAAGVALCSDPPPITSAAGLRAAIAYVADDAGFVQKHQVRILRQALAYLEVASDPSGHDPLFELIQRLDAELAFVSACCTTAREAGGGLSDEELNKASTGFDVVFVELRDRMPAATSEAGALAALRLARDKKRLDCAAISSALVDAALAYFDGRAS